MSRLASQPDSCLLCSSSRDVIPARFTYLYPQKADVSYLLDCWECLRCKGWFVYPVPEPAIIRKYWGTVPYASCNSERRIAHKKQHLHSLILERLARYTEFGSLLDFGCNFGRFLTMAKQAGWNPIGFEPSEEAADVARSRGFDVRSGWSLDQVDFSPNYFAAITAVDSFYYVWNPRTALETFLRLLKPGGVLAMRLTNKRLILGLARAAIPFCQTRNRMTSKIIQGQFHTISPSSFKRILEEVGFEVLGVERRAMTSTWQAAALRTKIAYMSSDLIYRCSFRKINLSPGVLLFAIKKTV